jgi:hypothetical protein
MVDTVAADTAYANGLAKLPLDATQRAVADRAITAYRALISNESAQANAGSFAQAFPYYSAHQELRGAAADAAFAVRTALGLPATTCSFAEVA